MALWKQSLSAAFQFIFIFLIMMLLPSTMSFNTFVEQQFAMEPQDQVAVVGARVILPCRVVNKQGVLQWTKDDFGLGTRRKLAGFDRYQMIGSDEEGDYSLQIYPVTLDDNAQFQCQVSPGPHGHPGVRSRYATLSVLVAPDPPVIIQGSNLITTEGREIELECVSANGRPAAESKNRKTGYVKNNNKMFLHLPVIVQIDNNNNNMNKKHNKLTLNCSCQKCVQKRIDKDKPPTEEQPKPTENQQSKANDVRQANTPATTTTVSAKKYIVQNSVADCIVIDDSSDSENELVTSTAQSGKHNNSNSTQISCAFKGVVVQPSSQTQPRNKRKRPAPTSSTEPSSLRSALPTKKKLKQLSISQYFSSTSSAIAQSDGREQKPTTAKQSSSITDGESTITGNPKTKQLKRPASTSSDDDVQLPLRLSESEWPPLGTRKKRQKREPNNPSQKDKLHRRDTHSDQSRVKNNVGINDEKAAASSNVNSATLPQQMNLTKDESDADLYDVDFHIVEDDIESLDGKTHVTDTALAYSMQFIKDEIHQVTNVQIVTPFIGDTLRFKPVEDWAEYLQRYKFDWNSILLFPLTNSVAGQAESSTHWYLISYHKGEARYYDSLRGPTSRQDHGIADFVVKLWGYMINSIGPNPNAKLTLTDCICCRQKDLTSCGLYVVTYIKQILECVRDGKDWGQLADFTPESVHAQRIVWLRNLTDKKMQQQNQRSVAAQSSANASSSQPASKKLVKSNSKTNQPPSNIKKFGKSNIKFHQPNEQLQRRHTNSDQISPNTLRNAIDNDLKQKPCSTSTSDPPVKYTIMSDAQRVQILASLQPSARILRMVEDAQQKKEMRRQKNPPKTSKTCTIKLNPFGMRQRTNDEIFQPRLLPVQPTKKKKKTVQKGAKKKTTTESNMNKPPAKPRPRRRKRQKMQNNDRTAPLLPKKNPVKHFRKYAKLGVIESVNNPHDCFLPLTSSATPMQVGVKAKRKPFKPKREGVQRQKTKQFDPRTEEHFTVSQTMGAFVRQNIVRSPNMPWTRQQIIDQFHLFVTTLSKLAIETSIMVFQRYMEVFDADPTFLIDVEPDFRVMFTVLIENGQGMNRENTMEMVRNFITMRSTHNVNNGRKYDGSHKTECIADLADRYKTCLANNVTEHTYKHLRKFFKVLQPKIQSYDTLGYLFTYDDKHVPNNILLNGIQTELRVPATRGYFSNLAKDWYTHIPMLLRLQRWRTERNLHSFRVFPIFRHRRHFIQFDTMALQQFLNSIHKLKYDNVKANENNLWRQIFNVEQWLPPNEDTGRPDDYQGARFFKSFRTDGVAVHLTMSRRKKTLGDAEQFVAKVGQQLANNEFDEIVALDPGGRLSFAGIRRNSNTNMETTMKYSSSSYRYDSKEYAINQKYRKFTKHHANEIHEARNLIQNKASCTADPTTFVNFELEHFDRNSDVFMQKYLAKLNFERLVWRQRTTARLGRQLAYGQLYTSEWKKNKRRERNRKYRFRKKRKKQTAINPNAPPDKYVPSVESKKPIPPRVLLFVGDTDISPFVKGYVKSPNRRIIKEAAKFATVVQINEFRSTMLCSRCFEPAVTSKSPHRWQYCKTCHVKWHRDINAARNIMYLGIHRINGTDPDHRFSKSFNFAKPARGYYSKSKKCKPNTRRDTLMHRRQMKQAKEHGAASQCVHTQSP